jgi:restriction system protein
MAIPDFQSVMLPLLRLAGDGREYALLDAAHRLADEFGLTPAERQELLPSGRQRTFENRVRWARTYLTKAGLLESPARGRFRITPRGKDILETKPSEINIGYLERFPEFVEFRSTTRTAGEEKQPRVVETPEELLENSYQALRADLARDLLDRVRRAPPDFFEQLVVDLLVSMGYGGSKKDAGEAVGRSGDEGIDGIIKEDKLGLDVVYVQAKRWQAPVGRPIVQSFAGSIEGQRARKGVLITTSHFTPDAREYVER